MKPNENRPKLVPRERNTELDFDYFAMKGYVPTAAVQLPNGKQYPIHIYDRESLEYDLKELGHGYVAEPGLIVVPEITRENIQDAINKLYLSGYFDHLNPLI